MDAGRVCEGPFQAKNQGKKKSRKLVFDIKTLAKNRLRRAMWLLISHLILYPPLSAPTPDLSRDTNLSAASFRGRGPPRIRLGDEVPPASLLFPAALRA